MFHFLSDESTYVWEATNSKKHKHIWRKRIEENPKSVLNSRLRKSKSNLSVTFAILVFFSVKINEWARSQKFISVQSDIFENRKSQLFSQNLLLQQLTDMYDHWPQGSDCINVLFERKVIKVILDSSTRAMAACDCTFRNQRTSISLKHQISLLSYHCSCSRLTHNGQIV